MRASRLLLVLAMLSAGATMLAVSESAPGEMVAFSSLPGFADDDLAAAFATFRTSCIAMINGAAAAKSALPPSVGLRCACSQAVLLPEPVDAAAAHAFFTAHFTPRRLAPEAFLTGYYEPVVEGSRTRSAAFTAPLLAAPAAAHGLPDRAAIEAGALGAAAPPLVWLRAPVDAFFVAIQGSARVRLPDGTLKRVAYAGRNGKPYTAIGKVLVQRLGISPADMSMAQLRGWIEAHGQSPGDAGRALMDENRSFIFFRFDDALPSESGPSGAAGVGLTPLRSLAVDRARWTYGLPVYVDAILPWRGEEPEPFHRLMVAQDTGAAIVGPARADIFFGTGQEAANRAGPIRQPGTLWVLWPKDPGEQPEGGAAAPPARR